MARHSPQRTDPPSTSPRTRHRRYRVLGALPALLLLAAGAYLGLALGNWILFDGSVLYLLICVVMIATDTPPHRPPVPSPDTPTDADAPQHVAVHGDDAPTRVPVAVAASPADRTLVPPPAP